MYDENDYLNYTDLNYIENKIEDLYDYYNMTYTPKLWQINEFIYVDDIKNIEEAIDTMASYFGYPSGYQTKRNWNLLGTNNISYRDLNRWLYNIDLLRNSEFTPLLPSENLLPSETLKPSNKIGE